MVAAKTGSQQIVVLVVLASCVALAGCSGTETPQTATPTDRGTRSPSSAGGAIHELTITNQTKTTDGATTALTLAVQANTTLWAGDVTSTPEPYFVVELNGQPAMQTTQVERRDNGTFTIELNTSIISSIPAGQTTVTVILLEADAVSDDRIDAASISVRTAPSVPPDQTQSPPTTAVSTETVSPTETSGSTATPPTTVATQTATPTATQPSTATTTATPEPTPTATPDLTSPIDGGTVRRATVTRVIDGDTVEVEFENGETDTVRLIGVDTPEPIMSNMDPSEYGIPETPSGRDWLLHWADEASAFATAELAGEQVLVVTDPESETRGYYGRLLAYIYYDDGTNFGKQLLQRGYARVYTGGEFVLEDEYLDLEASAQAADEGLWSFEDDQSSPTPTPEQSPEETASPVDLPPPSNDGDLPDPYDCSDFDGYPNDVLRTYMQNHPDDPSELDADGDGVACGVGYR